MRTIFHLDLDAFFVSVERILDPSLEGKPVIVGGDPKGRGVVAACSYEARKYGLHSAMPIKNAFRLCPHGIYLHGHGTEYSRYSKAVKGILEQYAPMMEQASIDEFYLDFTGTRKIYGNYLQFAEKLQREIWQRLSLPCSIGIAGNKTIAKIASDYNKPKGITMVMPGLEGEFLKPLPLKDMPGIGKATLKSLNDKGFYKIGDIAGTSQDYLASAFGKHGIELWKKANGEGKEFLTPPQLRKSISKEHTFGTDVIDKDKIENVMFELTGKICQSLRNKNWQATTVSIKLRYADFQTLTRSKTIEATDDDRTVFETAVKLFRKAYTRRVGIRLIGVHLSNFNYFAEQEILFEDENITRKKMLGAVNKIRDKFGYTAINIGKKDNER